MAPEGTYKMEHHPRTRGLVRLGLGMFKRSFHTASHPETATGIWLEKCRGGDSPQTQPVPLAPGAGHGLPQQGEGLGWAGPRRSRPWCEGMASDHSAALRWSLLTPINKSKGGFSPQKSRMPARDRFWISSLHSGRRLQAENHFPSLRGVSTKGTCLRFWSLQAHWHQASKERNLILFLNTQLTVRMFTRLNAYIWI